MIFSNKRITKALIRLRRCAGWSAPLLFANLQRQVFSCRGPIGINQCQSSCMIHNFVYTVKPDLSGHSKRRAKIGFQDRLLLNAGQKYCRMLQGEHSAILLTFIKLQFVIKVFLSIFDWPLKRGFTVMNAAKLLDQF